MPQAYRDRVRELSRILGIEEEIHKPIKGFSGGMKRKLEIVRGLIHQPRVLFLDEPTTGLDPASRRTLWDYLMEVRRTAGTTVFLTTHYLEEAEAADTICIVNRGQVVSLGTPDEIKHSLLGPTVEIDATDRAALRQELEGLGLPASGTGPFTIEAGGADVHHVLRQISVPLTSVRTRNPTVEDAYLAIVAAREAEEEVA
jgi:ABC-2 type transport system ATP-binding protein